MILPNSPDSALTQLTKDRNGFTAKPTMTVAGADLARVLEQFPSLTSDGLFQPNYAGKDLIGHAADVYASRADLFTDLSLERISQAVTWLGGWPKTKRINDWWTSYGLKHQFEREACYIPNGTFIVAAVLAGFAVKQCDPRSPNCYFNIGRRPMHRRSGAV